MRAALSGLLLFSACAQEIVDPCAGLIGTCVAVEVDGSPSPLDELDVSATQIPNGRGVLGRASLPSGGFNLPVQFAAILPDSLTGPLLVEVVGARNGQPLGYGSAALTVPPSDQRVHISMSPLNVGPGNPDLSRFQVGADLAMKGSTDMAVSPLSDLSTPRGDLAHITPCTGNCNVGSFVTQGQRLNPARTAFATVVVGNNVYILGGQANAATPAATTSVQRAPINPDGSLGQFVETGTPLTTARQIVAGAASSQFVYVVSGDTGGGVLGGVSLTNTVERAAINADGSLGPFSQLSSTLATAREGHAVAVIGSNLVVLGGDDGTNLLSSVEVAAILSDGSLGAFGTGPPMVTPRVPTLVISSSFLYAIGGENGGDVTIERAPISGGTLGSFALQSITLRTRRQAHAATQVGDNLYVTGGGVSDIDAGTASSFPTSFEVSAIDFTGALGNFTTVFGSALQTGRGGHGAVYTGNALYVFGGFNGGAGPIDSIERAPVQ
jgi:hypothetical protein